MSLKARLTWAFLLTVLMALVLAVVGLNLGLYSMMVGHHQGETMGPGHMMTMGSLGDVLRWSVGAGLAAFVIAGVTGWLMAERITRSLRHLRDAASDLDLRDLSQRVPVEGTDEISEVATAFNRMCDRLERTERSRRQLLADVAHELRHPLTLLQGRLDLMQEGRVPIDAEALLPLEDEVLRLTRLVGDLRDLSLAEVGGLALHRQRLDLGQQVSDLLGAMEPLAEEKGIGLAGEIAPNLPAISADPGRMRQVLTNLLLNALQYTDPGGRVTVRVQADHGGIQVQVCDTGRGIPDSDLPHIFDRFYRVEKSRSRESGGSGLGLAIVRSLVELHGGGVMVQSSEGEGSCFTVVLPKTSETTSL